MRKQTTTTFAILSLVAAVLFTFGNTASANTILVNFGAASSAVGGNGSLDVGGTWNSIVTPNNDLAAGSVVNSASAVVAGVSINTSNFRSAALANTGSWAGSTPWVDLDAATNTWYYGGTDATPATIIISGLTDLEYKLDFLAIRSSTPASERSADYDVNGSFGDSTPDGDNFNANIDGWNGGNVLGWSSITPAGGTISITITKIDGANYGYATALRLTAIPTPSAAAGGLALLVITTLRRRG